MKPILTWYEDLPEPIRSQAIENYDGTDIHQRSIAGAIFMGMAWLTTPQGAEYWADIYNRANSGEFDKQK